MPLLTPNTEMPFNITRISHVVLTSRDLDATVSMSLASALR